VLTKHAIAYAELGQLFKKSIFADSEEQAVTDPEVLTYVNGIVRSMISGRSLSVVGVTVDGGTFKGEARVKVSPRLTKRFGFAISLDSKTFEPLNADEIEEFADSGASAMSRASPVEFKVGGKILKCKIEQCGGRCLKAKEKCRLTMSPAEKKAHDKALRKVGTVDTSLAKKRREMKEVRNKKNNEYKKILKPYENILSQFSDHGRSGLAAEIAGKTVNEITTKKSGSKIMFRNALESGDEELLDSIKPIQSMSDNERKRLATDVLKRVQYPKLSEGGRNTLISNLLRYSNENAFEEEAKTGKGGGRFYNLTARRRREDKLRDDLIEQGWMRELSDKTKRESMILALLNF
jgi:hypothetical protein